MRTHTLTPSLDQESEKSKLSKSDLKCKAQKSKLQKVTQSVFQTLRKQYIAAVDRRTYRLINSSPPYDDAVSSYVAKLVNKLRSKLKKHLFNPKYVICIIRFLATFKLVCDTNNVHDGTDTWALPHYVKKTIDNTLNSRMCAQDRLTSLATSVHNEQP